MKKIILALALATAFAQPANATGFFDWFSSKDDSSIDDSSIFERARKSITESIEKMEESFLEFRQELSEQLYTPKVTSDYDTKKGVYFVEVELPGYEEKEIRIQAKISKDERMLTIKASKEKTTNSKQEKSSFQTTRTLPKNVHPEKANWTYKKGVLRIEMPTEAKPVTIIDIKKK